MNLSFTKFLPKAEKAKKKKPPVLFVELTDELHKQAKALAEKHGTTLTQLTRALLLAALEEDNHHQE